MLAVSLIENKPLSTKTALAHAPFLPDDAILYEEPRLNSIHEYNKRLTSLEFWNQFDEENILIIQHDSVILRNGIEDYYQYDFIGAPIKWIDFPAMNGGFSLRRKSAMINVIKNYHYNGLENEDLYFCNGLKQLNGNLPTFETGKTFSCETIFNLGSLGYHAIDKYLTNEQINQIKTQYE
jgi:hypothetical protein